MKTLFVIVPPPAAGADPRVCPIAAADNPNGGALLLNVGDKPLEVYDSTSIRRRIRSEDLKAVEAPTTKSK